MKRLLLGTSAVALVLAAGSPAYAQAADGKSDSVETVIVTGTHLQDRTLTNTTVPVDVLSAEAVHQSGQSETTEILRQIAPSFAFATPTTPDGNTHIHSASLRGLSPDETLVLVNGKRLHAAGWVNTGGTIGKGAVPVDLNQVPAAAIGHVEILRDGASSQYGSDAIAGVINILLRDDTAFHATAGTGVTNDGGGFTYDFSAGDGFKLGSDGFVNVTAYYRDHKGANRALPDTRQFYFGISPTGTPQALSSKYGAGIGLNPPGGVTGTVLDPREATANRNIWRFADEGDLKDFSTIANFEKPLGNGIELYGFAAYRFSKAHSNASLRRAGQDENVRAIYPDGFLPFINTASTDYSIDVGVKGDLAGWLWDLSTVYGGNRIGYRTENTVNATLGAASPTHFYDGEYGDWQSTTDLVFSRSFDVGLAGPLSTAFGAELRYDGYRIKPGEPNSYAYGPSPILDGPSKGAVPTIGSQGFAGIQPGDAVDTSRHNVGAFFEVGLQPLKRWQINLAGRYEDYSDFGSTANGQVSTRLELFEGLAARASISSGFHAPALAQQYFSSTSSRTIVNNTTGYPEYVLVRTAPVGSTLARALGAVDLTPEKSVNVSAGFTFGLGNFNASIDYYHIAIQDRIFLSSNYVDASGSRVLRNYLDSIGVPGITSVRYFTNAADSRTQGVDVTVGYAANLDEYGHLNLTAGYNYNQTKLQNIKATPSQITSLGIKTPLFDISERTRVERGQPRDKFSLGGVWSLDRFTVKLHGTRYGRVEQVGLTNQSAANVALVAKGTTPYRTLATESGSTGNFDVIQKLEPRWVTDLSVTAGLFDGVDLTLGANNLFNVYPTKNIASTPALSGADTYGVFPYSEFSPFGFSGAYYYVRLGVNL